MTRSIRIAATLFTAIILVAASCFISFHRAWGHREDTRCCASHGHRVQATFLVSSISCALCLIGITFQHSIYLARGASGDPLGLIRPKREPCAQAAVPFAISIYSPRHARAPPLR